MVPQCVLAAFPPEEQGQDPAKAVAVTTVGSTTPELVDLPFLDAHGLWEGRRSFTSLLGVWGEAGKILKLVGSSERSVNGGGMQEEKCINPLFLSRSLLFACGSD